MRKFAVSTNFYAHMAVNFYLEKRTDKKGDAPIRVSIMIKGVRLVTSTGCKIAPAKWNEEKHQVKKGAYNATGMSWAEINSVLNEIDKHFGAVEIDALTNGTEITTDSLKSEFSRVFRHKPEQSPANTSEQGQEPEEMGFWEYYDMFTAERGQKNEWTTATHQKFNALKNHLREWSEKRKMTLDFDSFSEDGLNDFILFCRETLDMKNSTIGKQIGFLKWFLRWTTLKGYNTNNAYQAFSPKLKTAQKQVIFLEWEELMRIFNYTVPPNGTIVTLRRPDGTEYQKTVHDAASIAKARDILCFCSFTSLRYSDANNLKKSNIAGDSFTITTIKTNDTLKIELNKYALAILERYKDIDLGIYALPRMTNQRMNIYVKDLCELCEINQLVTHTYYRGNERMEETMPKYEFIGTHTGRRTFICNALEMGIPAEIIMKWTGHADYKTMKPYIDVTNRAKAKAMTLFNDK